MRLLLLLCISLVQFTSAALAETTTTSDFGPEIDAVKKSLSPLLSPLRGDYTADILSNEINRKLEEEMQRKAAQDPEAAPSDRKRKSKPPYLCFLNQKEIITLIVRGSAIQKNFRFTKDCHINGKIDASAKIFRVDLSLKEAGPYFRIRFMVELSSAIDTKTKLIRMKARIFDGELMSAQREHEPDFEFLADYALVIDEEGKLIAPGNGTIYIKKFLRKKVDRLFTLLL